MSGKVGLDAEIAKRMKDKYDPKLEQKALDWIGAIINETAPIVRGNDGDALFEWLKDGVRLCKLINGIKPGTIPERKITMNPRHTLEERENINLYLGGCIKIGVPSQDMCLLGDLHSRHSIPAVLNNIYALGRQAQVTSSFNGPRLGVKYSISIEEQQRRKQAKEEQRKAYMAHRRMKSDSQLRRRNELELEQREEALKEFEQKETRKLTRQLSKGRISLEAFRQKSSENLLKIDQLKNSDADLSEVIPGIGAVKYGMDREIEQKRKKNYSTEKEEQVMDWIEAVSGEEIHSFYDDLKDGKVLCKLLNCIRPKMVRRINNRDTTLSHLDNIKMYLEGCGKLGVDRSALFSASDLYEQKDLHAVVNHFFMLSRRIQLLNLIDGPFLELNGSLSAPVSPRDPPKRIKVRPTLTEEAADGRRTSLDISAIQNREVVQENKAEPHSIPDTVYPTESIEKIGETEKTEKTEKTEEISNVEETTTNVDILSTEEEAKEPETIQFSKTPILTMFTPRFLVRSMFHTVMSLQYAFIRG